MINIAEIIKRFPEDFEYYNILTGICTVEILENDYIKILPGNIIINMDNIHLLKLLNVSYFLKKTNGIGRLILLILDIE